MMRLRKRVQCVAIALVMLCAALLLTFVVCAGRGLVRFTAGVGAVMLIAVSFAFIDMSTKQPAESHSWRTLVLQYLLMKLLTLAGRYVYRKFANSCRHVRRTQDAVLLAILHANERTSYGTEWRFRQIKNRNDYVTTHPLTNYAHYHRYVDRIEKGETNVLTKDPVVFLATSSGTTGKNKVVPITAHMKGPAAYRVGPLMYNFMDKKAGLSLQRVLIISYKSRIDHSECGLVKAPVSHYMSRFVPYVISPLEAYSLTNEQVALHVHAVFALNEREIGHIEALMATLVYSFWIYVEHNWTQICDDIESGILHCALDVDFHTMCALNSHLHSNPTRACELRNIFRQTCGFERVAKDIWPNLRFVRMLTTGGFMHHAKVLREVYMKDVIQLSLAHASSEGFLGFDVSVDPEESFYTAMIEYGFMEFIPEESVEETQPKTYFAEQLENGKCYEIVLTTPMGLYRYRLGDVVQIVDFLHQCPVYEFKYRVGQTLNLFWEKTPEYVLYKAIRETVSRLDVTLVDYTTTEDLFLQKLKGYKANSDIKHYVLFIELSDNNDVVRLNKTHQAQFDSTLCNLFEQYSTFRQNGSIGQLQVIQLQRGTFHLLKAKMIERVQNQQYKLPRVLRSVDLLAFLLANRLDRM